MEQVLHLLFFEKIILTKSDMYNAVRYLLMQKIYFNKYIIYYSGFYY